ncbi:hypothetical protein EG68_01727 [Paragonimus skrjabini miyazakii]|uniref:Uncharacterized protein n=1 Tax=Paragonimus skrjabini miyazakii TaxID=59628 RepID=A0A8S9Z451_9TREM|nr:hypothetical protein EG68_01727 [Paragonimus skrjabini miyazakii]
MLDGNYAQVYRGGSSALNFGRIDVAKDMITFSSEDFRRKLSLLATGKPPGADRIPSFILRNCTVTLITSFADFLQYFLKTMIVPRLCRPDTLIQ